jgi:hypothetical protein
MSDERTTVGPDSAAAAGTRPGSARGTAVKLAALLLATLCLVIGAACWLRTPRDGTPPTSSELPPGSDHGLFFKWPKPDFVVVLSAQQHGYLKPCGCSEVQYGGLEYRYNFIKSLQARGWPVLAYDLGDVPQVQGPAKLPNVQGLIKYKYAMEAMKEIGYSAVSFGEYEAALSLPRVIDEYALNSDKPAVLAANLLAKNVQFADPDRKGPEWGSSYVGSWQVTTAPGGTGTRVGALGIIGTHTAADVAALVKAGDLPTGVVIPPSVDSQITRTHPKTGFAPADKAITAGLADLGKAGAEFRVLLYQGPVELAKVLAQQKYFPQFNVILCLGVEDEPPGRPEVVGNTFIVRVGHKGKNVGVVGVYRTGNPAKPFDMRYQLVPMGPDYKTPAGKEKDNPILALMETYAREVQKDDYLAKYGKIPHSTQVSVKGMPALAGARTGYVGSEACKDCHKTAFAIWGKTDHAKAYQTLVTAKNPSLRQYDAECIVCHTIGFRYEGGFADADRTPKLRNVGCESCHGPCEVHKKNPRNKALYALINPWKAPAGETPPQTAKRQLRIESMCRECHDAENDVKWKAFLPKWTSGIEHMTPEDERQPED